MLELVNFFSSEYRARVRTCQRLFLFSIDVTTHQWYLSDVVQEMFRLDQYWILVLLYHQRK